MQPFRKKKSDERGVLLVLAANRDVGHTYIFCDRGVLWLYSGWGGEIWHGREKPLVKCRRLQQISYRDRTYRKSKVRGHFPSSWGIQPNIFFPETSKCGTSTGFRSHVRACLRQGFAAPRGIRGGFPAFYVFLWIDKTSPRRVVVSYRELGSRATTLAGGMEQGAPHRILLRSMWNRVK